MLSDAVFSVERELERELEAEDPCNGYDAFEEGSTLLAISSHLAATSSMVRRAAKSVMASALARASAARSRQYAA